MYTRTHTHTQTRIDRKFRRTIDVPPARGFDPSTLFDVYLVSSSQYPIFGYNSNTIFIALSVAIGIFQFGLGDAISYVLDRPRRTEHRSIDRVAIHRARGVANLGCSLATREGNSFHKNHFHWI